MRLAIESKLGLESSYDIAGMTEMYGPGTAIDCDEHNGLHYWADMFIIEILDPETGEVLEPGQKGEMVVTLLRKEAFPLVRYKIKDLTCIMDEECECGRTSPRIERISGRSDDMLIIRGINVFPSQVEHVLMQLPQVGDQYMILVDRVDDLDTMVVQVEIKPEAFSDKIEEMVALKKRIEYEMKKYLNIAVGVELKESGSLPRFEGKAKRVIDKRVY